MPPAVATPNVMKNPGFLWRSDFAVAEPAYTVAGSVFTDVVAGTYVPIGATEDGSEFSYAQSIEPIEAAEFFDPITWETVSRQGSISFVMLDWTLTKWKIALNGGSLTVVSGTGATQLNKLTPPIPGAEVRSGLLWESLDATVRIWMPKCINGAEIKSANKKVPSKAGIAAEFRFEVPTSGLPFHMHTAGTARA